MELNARRVTGGLGPRASVASGQSMVGDRRPLALIYPEVGQAGRTVADLTLELLEAEGLTTDRLDWNMAADGERLNTSRYRGVILPDARTLPLEVLPTLTDFIQPDDQRGTPGGSLVALGAPFLKLPVVRTGEHWAALDRAADPHRLTAMWPTPAFDADEAYEVDGILTLEPATSQEVMRGVTALKGVEGAVCCVHRPRGLGWSGTESPVSPLRFVPLVRVRDGKGRICGTTGAALVHATGAVWIILGASEHTLAAHAEYVAAFAVRTVKAIVCRCRLLSAGADAAAVCSGRPFVLGAHVLCADSGESGDVVYAIDGQIVASGLPGQTVVAPPQWEGEHEIRVRLGADVVTYSLHVYDPRPKRSQETVFVAGGEFVADGGRWRPVGLNYWPRSTSGLAPDLFWKGWLTHQLYDPNLIEDDLALVEDLGCNVVTGIKYERLDQAPALRDFLARCDRHHLRASVSLAGGDPLKPDPRLLRDLITAAGLHRDPAVFAYDLAWEPHLGDATARERLIIPWQRWVSDQYGSWEQACVAWGFTGGDHGPDDAHILEDGPWRGMVAAYYRFVDDLVTSGYSHAWRAIRGLGDRHLLGARTGYGGTGQSWVAAKVPLDLASGALYLDFVSPEAWGLRPDNAAEGGLTTAYGRAVSGGKPVFWAEFGVSIWDSPIQGRKAQGQLYEALLKMVEDSGANGAAGWWFPGGLRRDEGSDFGLFDADGTPRPAALALSVAARRMRSMQALPPAHDVFIEVERDRFVQGYAGVWSAYRERYVRERAAGRNPGVRLASSGTTTANCPLKGLGGSIYRGVGPVQALNGTFVRVCVGGQEVDDGGRVVLPAAIQVLAGNTSTAEWVQGVNLLVHLPGGQQLRAPLKGRVPFLGFGDFEPIDLPEISGELVLRLEVSGRSRFGPVFRLYA